MGHLGAGIDDAHKPCQGQPLMSKEILGQMGYLGPRIDDSHRQHRGQP